MPGHAVHEQRGEGVHRRVDVAEVPLVRRDLAGRVEVHLGEHQVELRLGEVGVDHGERQAVEGEVPGRVPRVLPRVGHRDDVVVDHVEPRLVAHAPALRMAHRVRVVLLQPHVDVEVVRLLRPQHPGERLAEHRRGVVGDPGRGDRRVELVGVGAPASDDVLGAGERVGKRRPAPSRGQAHPRPRRAACRHDEAQMGGRLGPTAIEVDGRRAVQHVVGDAVLRVRRRVLGAPETGGVGLVVAEQQLGVLGRVEVHHAQLVVLGADHRSALDRARSSARRCAAGTSTCCGTTSSAADGSARPRAHGCARRCGRAGRAARPWRR